jgi:hypothetical protein
MGFGLSEIVVFVGVIRGGTRLRLTSADSSSDEYDPRKAPFSTRLDLPARLARVTPFYMWLRKVSRAWAWGNRTVGYETQDAATDIGP